MKILIINGPNINFLGIREKAVYGTENYDELLRRIEKKAQETDCSVEVFQSNHEGAIIDRIQDAYSDGSEGIIINPGAYTHTSIALLDALNAVSIPAVEVHISDPDSRDEFRKISYVRAACVKTIKGHGFDGYLEAMDFLAEGNR